MLFIADGSKCYSIELYERYSEIGYSSPNKSKLLPCSADWESLTCNLKRFAATLKWQNMWLKGQVMSSMECEFVLWENWILLFRLQHRRFWKCSSRCKEIKNKIHKRASQRADSEAKCDKMASCGNRIFRLQDWNGYNRQDEYEK